MRALRQRLDELLLGIKQALLRHDKVGFGVDGFFVRGDGIVELAFVVERITEVEVCHGKVRFEADGFLARGDGGVEFPFVVERTTQIVVS